jgi:hypothetical protein
MYGERHPSKLKIAQAAAAHLVRNQRNQWCRLRRTWQPPSPKKRRSQPRTLVINVHA